MSSRAVLLGVSGCIAAYKAAEIVRRLRDLGVGVKVILTAHAQHFVGSLTFQALSSQRVITDMFAADAEAEIEHIALTRNHELLLVAPATANIIGKFARGIADDFLSTLYLSMPRPVVIAPGMNVEMWSHPSVQDNIAILKNRGVYFVDPEEGYLACGTVGAGRLADPQRIVDFAMRLLDSNREFSGKRFLITAGPTVEDIDPVRLLTNRSSGKMGYALASEALRRGAQVTLVSGPVSLPTPPGASVVAVRNTEEMRQATLSRFNDCDVAILSAAVCDFAPRQVAGQKIKKPKSGSWTLELVPTPDILGEMGRIKTRQILVGFAAESQDVVGNARAKLDAKRLHFIVANDITLPDSGFESDFNTAILLAPGGLPEHLPRLAKPGLAQIILDRVAKLMVNVAT